MRNYFPLTDFDFYAYVLSGLLLLVALDYASSSRDLILHWEWSVAQGVVLIAVAYVVGQLAALLSAWLLEYQLLRKLKSPSAIMLGFEEPGRRETLLRTLTGTRYLQRLSEPIIRTAKAKTSAAYNCRPEDLDRETIFQYGFAVARCSEDTCRRMDRDRREYEFSRNMALVGFLGSLALAVRAILLGEPPLLGWAALGVLATGAMFVRYIRYYSSYHSQVIRAAAIPKP